MSYVLLKCVKEKSKLRVKMISSQPFIKGINCQFPRDIREEGMYYVVKSEGVKLKGKFYTVMQKDIITCKTFDLNEVKKYIDDLTKIQGDNVNKIKPKTIFGEDDDSECIICFSEIKSSVFSPCGHYMTCGACSLRCKNCPICRAVIVAILKRDEIAD
jgi:hypothetical protein